MDEEREDDDRISQQKASKRPGAASTTWIIHDSEEDDIEASLGPTLTQNRATIDTNSDNESNTGANNNDSDLDDISAQDVSAHKNEFIRAETTPGVDNRSVETDNGVSSFYYVNIKSK